MCLCVRRLLFVFHQGALSAGKTTITSTEQANRCQSICIFKKSNCTEVTKIKSVDRFSFGGFYHFHQFRERFSSIFVTVFSLPLVILCTPFILLVALFRNGTEVKYKNSKTKVDVSWFTFSHQKKMECRSEVYTEMAILRNIQCTTEIEVSVRIFSIIFFWNL